MLKQFLWNFLIKRFTKQDIEDKIQELLDKISDKELLVKLIEYKLIGVSVDIETSDINLIDLSEKEKKHFLSACYELQNNDTLKRISDKLIQKQLNYAALKSLTIDDLSFKRATVNGIKLLNEEIDRFGNIYFDEYLKKKEEFDPHAIIDNIEEGGEPNGSVI